MEITVHPIPIAGGPETEAVPMVLVTTGRSPEGVLLPQVCRANVSDPTLPFDVEIQIRVTGAHRYECDELICRQREGGDAVTTSGLRAIPVPTLMAAVVEHAGTPVVIDADGRVQVVLGGRPEHDVRFLARPRGRGPGRGHRISDAELPEVARVYREAKPQHRQYDALMDAFDVGRGTVARAIERAVNAGYLDAAEAGKKSTRKKSPAKKKGGKR